jgi:hypothetical protein
MRIQRRSNDACRHAMSGSTRGGGGLAHASVALRLGASADRRAACLHGVWRRNQKNLIN